MLEKIVVLVVVGLIALMFFGNRLPQVLGDLGKGMRAFKEGMSEGGEAPQPKQVGGGRGKAAAKKSTRRVVGK